MFAEKVYEIIKQEIEGLDALYEDYIVHVVGVSGLTSLIEQKRIESCGVVNGRKLYSVL